MRTLSVGILMGLAASTSPCLPKDCHANKESEPSVLLQTKAKTALEYSSQVPAAKFSMKFALHSRKLNRRTGRSSHADASMLQGSWNAPEASYSETTFCVNMTFSTPSGFFTVPIQPDTGSQAFAVLAAPIVLKNNTCPYYSGDCRDLGIDDNGYVTGSWNAEVCAAGSSTISLGGVSVQPAFGAIYEQNKFFDSCSENNLGIAGAGLPMSAEEQPTF